MRRQTSEPSSHLGPSVIHLISLVCPGSITSHVFIHTISMIHVCTSTCVWTLDPPGYLYRILCQPNLLYCYKLNSLFPLDLSVLSNLPYLTFLDVSYNKLTRVLDFQPPQNLTVRMFTPAIIVRNACPFFVNSYEINGLLVIIIRCDVVSS